MENGKENGKATIVITYNSVKDFPNGTYQGKNGPVVIYSHDNTKTWGNQEAEGKLSQILHDIYGRADSEDVDKIYLYVGLYAKDGALNAAKNFTNKGSNLELVACDCSYSEKKNFAAQHNLPITWSECGGRNELKRIVENLL
ncbi:MAG: hypothetical protein KJ646_04170 [Nanoarchaeota archaeon]|nr:hypothetical protein [Nanoarchaeota archaeon]MBU4116491.1 hypothetical protein [Nanoarchaeota archaeon]